MKNKIIFLVVLFFTLNSSMVLEAQELVKGYYNSDKDWFVLEWDRPGEGKQTAVYDSLNKVDPIVKTNVVWDKNKNEYIFSFIILNKDKAKQLLDTIVIKFFSTIIYEQTAPNTDWSMDEYRAGRTDTWEWSKTTGEPTGIPPNGSQAGFSFKSKGLPTILDMYFLGEERIRYSPPGDYDNDEIVLSFNRVFDSLKQQYPKKFENVTRKTLGPKDPPADFKPIEFLNYIIALKHQSASLGWITNKGIENSLDQKLDNAKKKLEQGNITPAKNMLNAFINEVEAQNGKHLTSEAYGLLKYNVQYLIDKLK